MSAEQEFTELEKFHGLIGGAFANGVSIKDLLFLLEGSGDFIRTVDDLEIAMHVLVKVKEARSYG